MGKILGAALLLTSALALPAAAQPRYGYGYGPYGGPPRAYASRGVVDGVLRDEGGRCLVLRDRQNRNYYVQGDTRGLRPGDQVTLRERLLSRSSCGSDAPTLQVLEVRTVWTNGAHRSAYFDVRRDGSFDRFLLRSRDRGGWYADRSADLQPRPYAGPGPYDRRAPYDQGRPDNRPYDNGYAPNGQYDNRDQPNAPDNAPYDNGQNGQYDDQYIPNDQPPNGQYDDRDRSNGGDRPITLDGTLDFNRSCPAIRTSNGSYDLAGDLGNYHDGDRVRVTGFVGGASSCGGTALEVQEIRRR